MLVPRLSCVAHAGTQNFCGWCCITCCWERVSIETEAGAECVGGAAALAPRDCDGYNVFCLFACLFACLFVCLFVCLFD